MKKLIAVMIAGLFAAAGAYADDAKKADAKEAAPAKTEAKKDTKKADTKKAAAKKTEAKKDAKADEAKK